MGDDETPTFGDFTYSWRVMITPSETVEESEHYIPFLEENRTVTTRVEGPVTGDAWEKAVQEAQHAFVTTLADELEDYDLGDFEIEQEEDE